MNIGTDTFYWLFSTIAQTFGAIVGVLGLLVVYRFQNERDIRVELRGVVLPIVAGCSGREAYGWSATKIVKWYRKSKVTADWIYEQIAGQYVHFKDKRQRGVTREEALETVHLLDRIGDSVDYVGFMRSSFKLFLGYHLVLIVAFLTAIYFVPLGEWYSMHNDHGLNISLLILIGLLLALMGIVCFKLSWSLALAVIDGSQEWAEKQDKNKGGEES